MQLSDHAKALLEMLLMPSDQSPVCQERGKVYVRYDEIVISGYSRRGLFGTESGLIAEYRWRGKVMCTMEGSGVSMTGNDSFHMKGMDGKVEILVSAV